MIVVTGATGTVGRLVVDQLLATGARVRALTRRPERAQLPAGAEVVRADLGEPDSPADALAGADRVFLLSSGPDLPAHDAAVARAAARAGVSHIVKLSSGRAGDAAATDPIPAWHRAGERAVRDSGVAWTMVRPLGFMANALHWAPTVRDHDTVYAPYGQGRIAVVDPHDIAAVATKALTEPGHEASIYTLSGPQALTPGEQTGIIAEVLGRPLRYVETTPAQARAALLGFGVEPDMADAIMALRATALESFTSVVHPTVDIVTGRPPRTFREWVLAHRAHFER
ncbi:SDR family oxidoreductase [Nocardia blacklockiae]|uniref:SDR family oxidoreductase n=1 Tax=Nocardia blacklockiae TaxID=480036 RepID=UPI001894DD36|nr:SDR family oxidoreductase [Nocardia blacklockiae]MBF6174952.1 SDR family oxidoreductase [Nocardia blacklockiae]